MATFAQRVSFAANDMLVGPIQAAVVLTALAVSDGPRPVVDTTLDDRARMNARRAFAREVLRDPVAATPRLRWVLAGTDIVDVAAPTDDDFLIRVAAVWDALSGV